MILDLSGRRIKLFISISLSQVKDAWITSRISTKRIENSV